MPTLAGWNKLKKAADAKRFNEKQAELNSLSVIDYEAVNQVKWEYFRLIFQQEGEKVLASEAFKEFFKANQNGCGLTRHSATSETLTKRPTSGYGPSTTRISLRKLSRCAAGNSRLSAHLHLLFHSVSFAPPTLEATNYARANGVVLKGDIPSASAATVWKHGQSRTTST